MTTDQLFEKLQALVNVYRICYAGSTIPWRSERLDRIEAILHELVHGICLGGPEFCCDIEGYLPPLPEERDAQELMTLRVELQVYALLERPLSRRKALRLFNSAAFDGIRVSRSLFEAPLTEKELELAQQTVALIKAAPAYQE